MKRIAARYGDSVWAAFRPEGTRVSSPRWSGRRRASAGSRGTWGCEKNAE